MAADEVVGAAEHPAVRRIRHRRLLAFLWLQGLERTFQSYARAPDLPSLCLLQYLLTDLCRPSVQDGPRDWLRRLLRGAPE